MLLRVPIEARAGIFGLAHAIVAQRLEVGGFGALGIFRHASFDQPQRIVHLKDSEILLNQRQIGRAAVVVVGAIAADTTIGSGGRRKLGTVSLGIRG